MDSQASSKKKRIYDTAKNTSFEFIKSRKKEKATEPQQKNK